MVEHELLVLSSQMRWDRPPRGERVLAEVLEGGERFRARLNLIQDDEGATLGYDFPRLELDGRDDAGDVVAQLELLVHPRIVVEVHVRDVLELRPAKLLEQPSLSNLTRAVENEWFTAGSALQATSSSMRNRSMRAPPQNGYGLIFAQIGENKAVIKPFLEKISRSFTPTLCSAFSTQFTSFT